MLSYKHALAGTVIQRLPPGCFKRTAYSIVPWGENCVGMGTFPGTETFPGRVMEPARTIIPSAPHRPLIHYTVENQ